ncbi:hypothetical protein I7G86_19455 [Sinorhizobium meliloti]|uniref:Uncharacterized protein n=1 Tax=Sinorhizobium meliloti (strain SM11) TaxID=707241 RepID=F7XAX1_SINMM|nr:hypothetical protein [Sinorhizobium meliloti]AEH81155.1 Hypothetical protein SM11_pC0082 [Sinorhizobium meliloti SM11]ARS67270.1 hypothetical protein SMRU11_08825 [Sinorhizobium meliloti RU11/001]MDE3763933.1 hypothetical protein [Sinorhizobium meliloti]MDE3776295.1 hypothetical protein [Sinorhizobium meliloti]MDE3792803.1 hypothetical protein [Sinorhizobium meliloti]
MTALYDGLQFKTPLEAQWAAFFDLAGWEWRVNPSPVGDWSPDLRVSFPCGHTECSGSHTLLVSVLPISNVEDFGTHPALSYSYSVPGTKADAGAVFGSSPTVTRWEMAHGAGGGLDDVTYWVENASALWTKAATLVS